MTEETQAPSEPAQSPPVDGEPVPVGEMRDGWRTPMDNPAHPLHHLRNT